MLRGNKAATSQYHTRTSLLSSVPTIAASNAVTKSVIGARPSGNAAMIGRSEGPSGSSVSGFTNHRTLELSPE